MGAFEIDDWSKGLTKRAIVIGGGIAGLASAALLGKSGMQLIFMNQGIRWEAEHTFGKKKAFDLIWDLAGISCLMPSSSFSS